VECSAANDTLKDHPHRAVSHLVIERNTGSLCIRCIFYTTIRRNLYFRRYVRRFPPGD